MKNQWWGSGLGALFLGAVSFWILQGCNGTNPPITSVVQPPLPGTNISNFHEVSLAVNPTLTNGTGGFFQAETYGGSAGHNNEINGSTNPIVLFPRQDTGQYAVHLYGMEYDIPTATTNPAMELFCFFRNDPANPSDPYIYDLSSFTGVQFDYLTPTDDKSTARFFEIGITLDTPPTAFPGGTCPPVYSSNCYNYFSVNVNKSAVWKTMIVPFSTMTVRFSNGDGIAGNLNTTTMVNGQSVPYKSLALFLLWSWNNGGGANPPAQEYLDFWVDNVQFY